MTNIIGDIRYTIDVPEDRVVALVGREDDQTDEWFYDACVAVERALSDDPLYYIENHLHSEEVSVD